MPDMSSHGPTRNSVAGNAQKAGDLAFQFVADPRSPFLQESGCDCLMEHLGRGALGTVYLGLDLKLEIKVALRVPCPEIIAVPRLKERFYRETRAGTRLVHPGLGWVVDVGQVEGTHELVMR